MNSNIVILLLALLMSPVVCPVSEVQAQNYFLGIGIEEAGGNGVRITSIVPGGPATQLTNPYDAGFHSPQVGDLVVTLNGLPTSDINSFNFAVASLAGSGGQATVSIRNQSTGTLEQWNIRAQQTSSGPLPVQQNPNEPGGRPPWNGQPPVAPQYPTQPATVTADLGITGRMVSSGFLITGVDPAGPAANATDQFGRRGSLQINQVINTINSRPINSESDYRSALAALGMTGGIAQVGVIDVTSGGLKIWTVTTFNTQTVQPVPPGPATVTTQTGRIHFFLCGAPAADISTSVNASISDLRSAISIQVDRSLIASNIELTGAACSRNGILQSLDNIQAGAEDAVFVYYVGHGAFDGSGGHYCDFVEGYDLLRSEIQTKLDQKGARLTVLLTESCYQESVAYLPQDDAASMLDFTDQGASMTPVVPKTLEMLLMNYRGRVDVNSSDRGQLGWGTNDGGMFTTALVNQLERIQTNPTWNGTISVAGQNANQSFMTMRQAELQKFRDFPGLAQNPQQAYLRDQLQRLAGMTPAIFNMNVF